MGKGLRLLIRSTGYNQSKRLHVTFLQMMKETGYFEDLMSWVGKGGTLCSLLMFDFMCMCIFYFLNAYYLPTDQRLLHVLGKVGSWVRWDT